MVEMALHAGDRARCPRVNDLILHTPLTVGEHGGVAVQVVVGAWTDSGERTVRTYSRIDDGADRAWTRRAEGVLSSIDMPADTADLTQCPREFVGIRGIGAAVKLDKASLHDYLIIEAGGGPGGTWHWNTYLGIAVDIPSFSYQFSFQTEPQLAYAPPSCIASAQSMCASKPSDSAIAR
jgi:hypothetical protein